MHWIYIVLITIGIVWIAINWVFMGIRIIVLFIAVDMINCINKKKEKKERRSTVRREICLSLPSILLLLTGLLPIAVTSDMCRVINIEDEYEHQEAYKPQKKKNWNTKYSFW